jgi:competence protein ComFB
LEQIPFNGCQGSGIDHDPCSVSGDAREVVLELVNYMEDVVASYVDEVAMKDKSFCGCPRCRLDVIAIALNDMKPKYLVTTKGYAYARIGELQAQFRADTIVAVTRALKIVSKNPRH